MPLIGTKTIRITIQLSKYRMKYKYTFGLILLTLLAASCKKNSEGLYNDLKMYKLQGPVKTISEIDYSNTGKYTTYLSFNADGFTQEQSTYNQDGSLIRKWKFEYNNLNQKISRSCYILKDSLSEILHYSYNENAKLKNEKSVNPKGRLITEIKHEYDSRQNEIEKKFYDENSKIQGGIRYIYDNNNNVVEELQYDSVYNQNLKQKKTYNPEGLNVETVYLTMHDSLLRRVTNVFLPNKQVGETCTYYSLNELVSKTTYEYDKKLNVIRKLIYSPQDKTTEKHTFEYTYDKYKNWTSRNEYINGEPVDMITRKIEYY